METYKNPTKLCQNHWNPVKPSKNLFQTQFNQVISIQSQYFPVQPNKIQAKPLETHLNQEKTTEAQQNQLNPLKPMKTL